MRVLVCGGRDYTNAARVAMVLDLLGPSLVIHGKARGADTLAMEWAIRNGVPHLPFPANWDRDGRSAGPIRNRQMQREGQPEFGIAFPGGNGTADMVSVLHRYRVPVLDLRLELGYSV